MAPNYNRNDLFSVEGLVAVITGGGSGLGSNVALALDANGAKAVYILGRRQEALDRTASAATNGSIRTIVCDVTSKDSLSSAASHIRSETGYINVLYANSGIIGPKAAHLFPKTGSKPSISDLQSGLWEPSIADFTNVMNVNVSGVYFTSVAFLDLLDAGNRKANVVQKSQILVTSSIAAFARSPAAGIAYTASKAATTQMVKMFATCFAPYLIRVNAVAPGLYPSEMTGEMPFMKSGKDPRVEGGIEEGMVPLNRTGSEEDIAGMALFLMSRAGGYVSGSVQITDGGRIGVQPASY